MWNENICGMKLLFLLVGATLSFGQEICHTPAVPEGKCYAFIQCPLLGPIAENLIPNDFLRLYGGCGKNVDGNVQVCCPVQFLPSTSTSSPPISTSSPPISTSSSTTSTSTSSTTTSEAPVTNTHTIPIRTTPHPSAKICPATYNMISGQCLYIAKLGTDHSSWSEAQKQCSEKDGFLAVLRDEQVLARYLSSNGLGGSSAWYWVGANDFETPGTFRWTSGEPVLGTWRDSKPWTERPGQMCVYFTNVGFGRTPCGDNTWFICQYSQA